MNFDYEKITKALINFAKFYFSFALLAVLLTMPTKGVYMLCKFVWDLF